MEAGRARRGRACGTIGAGASWEREHHGRANVTITGRRLTLEEFLALPEEKPALEYADGEVTQKVSPTTVQSVLKMAGRDLVDGFVRPRKLARAFPEHRSSYAGASTVPEVIPGFQFDVGALFAALDAD